MKKIITSIISFGIALPLFVSAATFNVTPNKTSYQVGDNIVLNISVNPENSKIYTSSLVADFSTTTLEMVSFSMNDNMLPLKQAGYDLLDNQKGSLIKTGGYAGGINSTTNFGTLTLRAKSAGSGEFNVLTSSLLFDENNINKFSNKQNLTFNISSKPISKEIVKKIATTTEQITTTVAVPVKESKGLFTWLHSLLYGVAFVIAVGVGYLIGQTFAKGGSNK